MPPTKRIFTIAVIIVLILSFWLPQPAEAFSFKYKELKGFVDTTLSSGGYIRTEERDADLIGRANGGNAFSVNGDDGDRNYSKGQMVSAVSKATHDIGLSFMNYSGFFRTTYFVDWANRWKKELTSSEQRAAGQGFQVLDAYLRGHWKIFGREADLRGGKEALNWGESIFIPGGLSQINPVDVTKLRAPGSELKEAYLPTPMISTSLQLTERLSTEAFYIFRFDRTRSDVCGTFFSTDDVGCENGEGKIFSGFGLVPEGTTNQTIRVIEPTPAKDDGQFGVGLHYLLPELNNTEFGFFYVNYHSRIGMASAIATRPGQNPLVFLEYPENIHTFATSFNTQIPKIGVAFQGEYSFRRNVPFQLETNDVLTAASFSNAGLIPAATSRDEVIHGYRRLPMHQIQGALTKSFGRLNPFFADDWNVVGEAALIHVAHMPSISSLHFEAPGTNFAAYPGVGSPQLQQGGWADPFSWGYVLATSATYNNIIHNINAVPRFSFSHNVRGTTPGSGGNFIEGRMAMTYGLTFTYLERWALDGSYTRYWGGSGANALHDRDFASFGIKYSF